MSSDNSDSADSHLNLSSASDSDYSVDSIPEEFPSEVPETSSTSNAFIIEIKNEILSKLNAVLNDNKKLRKELHKNNKKIKRLNQNVEKLATKVTSLTNAVNGNSIKLGKVTQEVEGTKLSPHEIIRSSYLTQRKFVRQIKGEEKATTSGEFMPTSLF